MGSKRRLVEKTVAKFRSVSTAQSSSVKFGPRDVELIIQSLPAGVDQQRLEILPKILRDWGSNELKMHLSLEPLPQIRDRGKKIEVFKRRARDLLLALDALEKRGRLMVAAEIARFRYCEVHGIANQEKYYDFEHAEFIVNRELFIVHNFLTQLASIAPRKTLKIPPRNYAAYLVLKDIARIFEWLTDRKATRQVDRDGKGGEGDIGPFWEFAKAIWPLVFRNGTYGLKNAMKNWAKARKQYGESALMANIALRHPAWGVFEP